MEVVKIPFGGKEIEVKINESEEAFWRIPSFGKQNYEVEFSVDLTKPFDKQNWQHLPNLLTFLDEKLPHYIEQSLEALPTFARQSRIFNAEEMSDLNFEFNFVINIPDNSRCWHIGFHNTSENWAFELVFVESNYDETGNYIVSFEGKILSGIRREWA